MYDDHQPRWAHDSSGVRRIICSSFKNEDAIWYETPEAIMRKLSWGRRKARLLTWVRERINTELTTSERRCIVLCHFHGLSYRDIGLAMHLHPSSVYRAIRRGVRKLRVCAEREGGADGVLHAPRRALPGRPRGSSCLWPRRAARVRSRAV